MLGVRRSNRVRIFLCRNNSLGKTLVVACGVVERYDSNNWANLVIKLVVYSEQMVLAVP